MRGRILFVVGACLRLPAASRAGGNDKSIMNNGCGNKLAFLFKTLICIEKCNVQNKKCKLKKKDLFHFEFCNLNYPFCIKV